MLSLEKGARGIHSVGPRIAATLEEADLSEHELLLKIVPEDLLRHPEIIGFLPLSEQINLLTSDSAKNNDEIAESLSVTFEGTGQATIDSEIDKLSPALRFHSEIISMRCSIHALRDLLESGFLETIPD